MRTIDPSKLDLYFSPAQQQHYTNLLMGRVGVTQRRAECLIRLWAYLWLKSELEQTDTVVSIDTLQQPSRAMSCTCSEAAALFYPEGDRGSERAAGMMLDKLAALGLIQKTFNGNTLMLNVKIIPELNPSTQSPIVVQPDAFNPRCDAIPVANLLAYNYNWMNRSSDTIPYRITQLLRNWADQYPVGMRVLRRTDNQNPVGFYLLYPTHSDFDVKFFGPPSKALHLSTITEADPFSMATPGDQTCRSIFVRSWMIEHQFWHSSQGLFLQDAQKTLKLMQQDFSNICDLYTLMIHPIYEHLIQTLGFQKIGLDTQSSVYWLYLPIDYFLALNIEQLYN